MPGSLKIIGITACGLVGLLVSGVLALPLLLNSTFMKQRLQTRVATSFELELGIGGRLEMDIFPGLQFTVNDMHFGRQGSAVATVRQAQIGVDLWPLLHKEVRINSIELQEPVILLERYQDGSYNVRSPEPRVTLNLIHVLVANATFHYNDALLATQYEANTCNLDLQGSRPLTRDSWEQLADLDLAAEFDCAELRKDELSVTALKFSALAQEGVLQLEPLSVQMFGARGTGQVRADYTGAVPVYQLSYGLPQFRIDDLFRMLIPRRTPDGVLVEGAPEEGALVEGTLVEGTLVEGLMDFTTTLSTQGETLLEAQRALSGVIALRGENLVINGADVDERLARFESSQNFNLVDAGAFLLAGPLGLVVTKGYNFANIFWEAGTRSEIPSLVSDWEVAEGVAEARYVMMTTNENRLALKGGLDFPDQQFNNMSIALLDANGCARVEQAIRGSFQSPEIEKPNVFWSLAGPVRTLLQKLVPGEKCEAFYGQ